MGRRIVTEAQLPGPRGREARLGIHLSPELKRRLAILAAERGETLGALVTRAIEKMLAEGVDNEND